MKSIAIASALALAGTLASAAAQAREPDVQWSVTIGSPGYSRPAPVYVPAPVVVPAPVYRAPVYRAPAPVMVYPRHVPVRYDRPTRWDHDGDGIPNRHDRLYNPVWDRDGDGIPNRHDRYDNRGFRDSDRDGVPNRYDRFDRHPGRH